MNDNTQSLTESLLDIIRGIHNKSIMLPEFQRDFRWEMSQTYDLFDSLIRNIFIGTIIYGKPSFGITLRGIDLRPRRGRGSRQALELYHFTDEEIKRQSQEQNLRIILDGQQRVTSIYRAITGIDEVYFILKPDLDPQTINQYSLEDMVLEVAGDESPDSISVKLSYAYQTEVSGLEAEEQNEWFEQTRYARTMLADASDEEMKHATRIYRRALRKLIDLFKQQKTVAYYLLDLELEKFCLFFERSNSRGIQLNFIDILAAKLYRGFNLRQKIEDFETKYDMSLNREIIVRAIAYVSGLSAQEATPRKAISIDRQYILKYLDVDDFNRHWDTMCAHYVECWNYLFSKQYVLSRDWIASENMILPLMMFRYASQGFDSITAEQQQFLEYWYWASTFANRYSGSSNEVIIADSAVLIQVARQKFAVTRNYVSRLRSLVDEPEDLFGYTKRTSSIYRGMLNLIGYAAGGLRDWSNGKYLDPSMKLEDHRIYPRPYLNSHPELDISPAEAEQLVDSVINRSLIPKLLLRIANKGPQQYLSELQSKNPRLAECLQDHLIPPDMITDSRWNEDFKLFLEQRAAAMFALIKRYAIDPTDKIIERYGAGSSISDKISRKRKARMDDLLANGLIEIGERVFIKTRPTCRATLVGSDLVEYEGEIMPINAWGEQMTGWTSINIYEQICLERTRLPIDNLR
ncbi:MAG: DUF262 domain-containing protein [Chloroflexaceae bacterium]|nr:DUF262 domain-containing protein [Chloroflexaceae bacterium]